MSAFTLMNIMDAEDVAAARGISEVESRMLRKHLDSQELGVSYIRYGPGFRTSFGHNHKEQEEAYVVISGSGLAKLGEDIIELKQWDVLRVAHDVVRGFEGGPEGLELIAVGGRRPAEGDGEMFPDWWTD
jgi:uncharacterized cupin superfamily protein